MKRYRAKSPPRGAEFPPGQHWTDGEVKPVQGEHPDPPDWLELVPPAKKGKQKPAA